MIFQRVAVESLIVLSLFGN